MDDNRIMVIILIVGALILAYWILSRERTEGFSNSPYSASKSLDKFYEQNQDIADLKVDNLTCHPSCCGDQWPVPFDGLDSHEIESCLETGGERGPFVRSNMTCANGINGVGCPCLTKPAYLNLANRGQNARSVDEPDPTFFIKREVVKPMVYNTPYEEIQIRKSSFSDKRTLNDLELTRPSKDLSNLKSNGGPLPKDRQLDLM